MKVASDPAVMSSILLAGELCPLHAAIRAALEAAGYRVVDKVPDSEDEGVAGDFCSLALLCLPRLDAAQLALVQKVRANLPHTPLVTISPEASGTAIGQALRFGVANVFRSAPEPPLLLELVRELLALEDVPPPGVGAWGRRLDLLLERVGKSDVPVLLHGETGVGKEVLARKLHARSPRAGRAFLKLNCAALPSELVESELFGYERGAFTGAFKTTLGKFELAHEGTILLDEIGDMDFKLQAKLLQVVQDHEFLRLGAKETSKVDVRVMSATHCDLESAIAEGRFREDLFYRLNIIEIHIPPLRDRLDEILPLATHFLELHGLPGLVPPLPAGLREALVDYPWPGNVRELENVMRRYLVLQDADTVARELRRKGRRSTATLGEPPQPAAARAELPERLLAPSLETSTLEQVDSAHRAAEAEIILRALQSAQWNRKRAAALLDIDYKALLYRMKKLGIGQKGEED